MTACRNKASRAVTAALVGVLSVGAVPMVAMAAGVNDGAQMMALTPSESFAKGKLTGATNGKGGAVEINEDAVYNFAAGSGEYLVPTEVTTYDGVVVPLDADTFGGNDNAELHYFDADGSKHTGSLDSLAAGTYSVKVVMIDGDYKGFSVTFKFSVRGNLLAEATLFDNSNGAGDVTDTTFTWNGKGQASTIGVAVDGVALTSGTDYTIDWKKVDASGKGNAVADVTDAGSYLAVVKGNGSYTGQSVTIPFTVEKLDFSKVEISISDAVASGYLPSVEDVTVNGDLELTNAGTAGKINLPKMTITVNGNYSGTGAYTATVSAQADATNITGSKSVEFNVVNRKLGAAAFTYNGNAFATLPIDLSEGEKFDASKIAVKDNGEDVKFDVWYTDADGNEVSESDLQQPGSYVVYARVDAAANYFDLGSDVESFTVNVKGGTVANEDVQFRYDGKLVGTKLDVIYDAEDVLDDIETVATIDGKTLVAGEDYDVVVKKGTQKVDSIVDKGTYTVELESTKYDGINGQSLTVEVHAVNIDTVTFSQDGFFTYTDTAADTTNSFLPYTGEVIETPKLIYSSYDLDGNLIVDENGNPVWKELPAECWTIDSLDYTAKGSSTTVKVSEVKGLGEYTINPKAGDKVSNYGGSSIKRVLTFNVSDAKVYTDVANNQWYSQYVYDAATKGYMTGYNGTTLFGPTDSIKRGDVAVVLFKMAGGSLQYDKVLNEGGSLDGVFYNTPFSDVDGHTYYAQAIQWAAKLGIVSGDDNADTFRPADTVTREELAKMLYKYMELQGKTSDVDEDAILSEYEDESTVSDWAREYVAWMVDQDVMGQDSGLKGHDPIMRLEVATMTVRIQPDGKLNSDLLPR